MHHFLSKPDWLAELNEDLAKRNVRTALVFDRDFVLVELDWLNGRNPDDVADTIAAGEHKLVRLGVADTNPANA